MAAYKFEWISMNMISQKTLLGANADNEVKD